MNHFKALMVARRIEAIERLSLEVADIELQIKALPKVRWAAKRKLKERRKEIKEWIRHMNFEIMMARL